MKKDIKWLKGRIKGFQEGENMFTAEFNAGVQDALEYVQELIDQLDEPEKPVIPQFVADYIEEHNLHGNNPLREYQDLESDFNEGWTDEKDAAVYHWINKNTYAFIDALRYGYEVEKEKMYQVKLPTERLHHILTMHGDGKGHFFGKEHTNNF